MRKSLIVSILIILVTFAIGYFIIKHHSSTTANPSMKPFTMQAYRLPYTKITVTPEEKRLVHGESFEGGEQYALVVVAIDEETVVLLQESWAVLPGALTEYTSTVYKNGSPALVKQYSAGTELSMEAGDGAYITCNDTACAGALRINGVSENKIVPITNLFDLPEEHMGPEQKKVWLHSLTKEKYYAKILALPGFSAMTIEDKSFEKMLVLAEQDLEKMQVEAAKTVQGIYRSNFEIVYGQKMEFPDFTLTFLDEKNDKNIAALVTSSDLPEKRVLIPVSGLNLPGQGFSYRGVDYAIELIPENGYYVKARVFTDKDRFWADK